MEHINFRVGRYLYFMSAFSAGMWNASTCRAIHPKAKCFRLTILPAFLPSSFAMYMNTLAFAYTLAPPSVENNKRTLYATVLFAAGAIIGWPFALAISLPFVFEELFIRGADRLKTDKWGTWFSARATRLFVAGAASACLFVSFLLAFFFTATDVLP